MKATILQENLTKGLSLVSRIVPLRPSLPVLGNVLLAARDGKMTLSATNLEVGMSLRLSAQVAEEGEISVPAKLFAEFIGSLPPVEITIETKDKTLEIRTQTHHSTLNGIDAGEFPPLPKAFGESVLKIENTTFDTAISQVAFTAASDESRPVLSGVLLTADKSKVNMVTTDGFRLSHKTITREAALDEELKCIIPARGLLEVSRVLKEKDFSAGEKEFVMGFTEDRNQAVFTFPNAEISCRLLEGQFPDYKRIIPKEFSVRTIVDREELTKAVKLASIFARDDANVIRITISAENKKIAVAAQTKELGQSQTDIEGSVEGESLTIAFNARFINDILLVLDSLQVSFEFSGALSPAQIKAVGDNTFFHILMPIRTETAQS